jgi:hypothetical protein
MSAVLEMTPSTGTVNSDNERIDRLKEQLRSTPLTLDFERVRIMQEVYEESAGDPQINRRLHRSHPRSSTQSHHQHRGGRDGGRVRGCAAGIFPLKALISGQGCWWVFGKEN